MYGRQVEVFHWKAEWEKNYTDEKGNPAVFTKTAYFPTREEAEITGGTITPVDSSAYDWMDGFIMPDVPDTMAEAVKIFEMGQAAYEAKCKRETAQKPEQIRADIDYMMLMGGF